LRFAAVVGRLQLETRTTTPADAVPARLRPHGYQVTA
jgi:hypothetical protein